MRFKFVKRLSDAGIPVINIIKVPNFSPEHSGTEKDQRGYPLCFLFKL